MKLCVECKHHKVSQWDSEVTCHHPVFDGSPCPVTGYVSRGTSCGQERSKGIFFHHLFKSCGPTGKLWEPIPPEEESKPLVLNKDAFLGGTGGGGTVTIVVDGDKS